MKFLISSFLIFFLSLSSSQAQRGITTTKGALSLGMGGAGVGLTGINAMLHNPAGIVEIEDFGILLSSERRFLLEELTAVSIAAAYKLENLGTLGILVSNFGFELFGEQKYALAYARKLSKNFSIGAQLDYFATRIENFGSKSLVSFELGILANVTEDISVAAHVFNPGKQELTDDTEIPTRLRLGVRYNISESLYFMIEGDKILDRPIGIHAGMDYKIIPMLDLRFGFNSNPGTFSFGVAYNINQKLSVQGAYSYQETLGVTPGMSVQYSKK